MKKPFEVGDRVRVYGHVMRKSIWFASFWHGEKATVLDVSNSGLTLKVKVRGMKPAVFEVASGQCKLRRFKPRPQKEREARIASVNITPLHEVRGCAVSGNGYQNRLGEFYVDNDTVTFREVLPGESVITREKLAAAWDSVCHTKHNDPESWFPDFAKALGLEAK